MSASPPPQLWKILRHSRLWWSDSHHWPRWPSTLVSSEKPSSSLRAVAGWLSSKKAGINEHQRLEMEDTIPLAFHPSSPDPQNDVDSGKEGEREAEKDGERKHPFINMKKQESLPCLQHPRATCCGPRSGFVSAEGGSGGGGSPLRSWKTGQLPAGRYQLG